MLKERPILFSAAMVRALLAGTKTQTRRIAKGDPFFYNPPRGPYGQPGDRLRVKESAWMWCERRPNGNTKTGRQKWLYVPMRGAPIHYAADHSKKPGIDVVSPETGNQWGWRLKIGRFLPAWASRITLEITGVRVERLQDISREDAAAEGWNPAVDVCSPLIWYAALWESINGPGSWALNPWVWVIEFRRAATC